MNETLSGWMEFFNPDTFTLVKTIGIGYVALLWLSIIIWVTRDALSRSNNLAFQAFVILINIFVPILGVLIYLIIRPRTTLLEQLYGNMEEQLSGDEIGTENERNETRLACEKCLMAVHKDYIFCPSCSHQLKKICPHCKKAFSKNWNICPFCGTKYKEKTENKKKGDKDKYDKKNEKSHEKPKKKEQEIDNDTES